MCLRIILALLRIRLIWRYDLECLDKSSNAIIVSKPLSLNLFTIAINNNILIISSYPFIFKDLFLSVYLIAASISIFLYWEPDILGKTQIPFSSVDLILTIVLI